MTPIISCSPALAGYLGMRDPEAAKFVDFTVHTDSNDNNGNCVYGDSCQGLADEISNLTRAMSELFHVEFHAATATEKSFAEFVEEVCRLFVFLRCEFVLSAVPVNALLVVRNF